MKIIVAFCVVLSVVLFGDVFVLEGGYEREGNIYITGNITGGRMPSPVVSFYEPASEEMGGASIIIEKEKCDFNPRGNIVSTTNVDKYGNKIVNIKWKGNVRAISYLMSYKFHKKIAFDPQLLCDEFPVNVEDGLDDFLSVAGDKNIPSIGMVNYEYEAVLKAMQLAGGKTNYYKYLGAVLKKAGIPVRYSYAIALPIEMKVIGKSSKWSIMPNKGIVGYMEVYFPSAGWVSIEPDSFLQVPLNLVRVASFPSIKDIFDSKFVVAKVGNRHVENIFEEPAGVKSNIKITAKDEYANYNIFIPYFNVLGEDFSIFKNLDIYLNDRYSILELGTKRKGVFQRINLDRDMFVKTLTVKAHAPFNGKIMVELCIYKGDNKVKKNILYKRKKTFSFFGINNKGLLTYRVNKNLKKGVYWIEIRTLFNVVDIWLYGEQLFPSSVEDTILGSTRGEYVNGDIHISLNP